MTVEIRAEVTEEEAAQLRALAAAMRVKFAVLAGSAIRKGLS